MARTQAATRASAPDAVLVAGRLNESVGIRGNVASVKGFMSEDGEDPSCHAASACAAMRLLAEAVRETGSPDRERLRKDGTRVGHLSIIIQWQKGIQEIVRPDRMRTARPVFP